MVRCSPRDGAGNRKQEVLGIRVGRLGISSSWAACTTLTCLPGLVRSRLLRRHRLRTSRLSREEEAAGARAGRKCPHRAPGAVSRVTVGSVPASKMAAAAISGALGRAGWRLLQLRCLPGEGTAEPGSVEGEGEGTKPTGLGTGSEEVVVAARNQGDVKGIGADPPASWSRRGRLDDFCPDSRAVRGKE